MKKITVIFKGDFYGTDFFGYNYLSEILRDYGIKRTTIKEWYKN